MGGEGKNLTEQMDSNINCKQINKILWFKPIILESFVTRQNITAADPSHLKRKLCE